MPTDREHGTVIAWKNDKGHGRIQSDAGDVLWAHFSEIVGEGFRALSVGQRVEFTRVETPGPKVQRWQARSIQPLV